MKKEKNAAKPKTKRPAKPKKEPVSQWMTNPLNEQVLDYHNYEMTQGEQVLYFILAFLIGGVVSQFFRSEGGRRAHPADLYQQCSGLCGGGSDCRPGISAGAQP